MQVLQPVFLGFLPCCSVFLLLCSSRFQVCKIKIVVWETKWEEPKRIHNCHRKARISSLISFRMTHWACSKLKLKIFQRRVCVTHLSSGFLARTLLSMKKRKISSKTSNLQESKFTSKISAVDRWTPFNLSDIRTPVLPQVHMKMKNAPCYLLGG